ncbi:MAG: hypothetical protein ACRDJ1_01495 [Actinomycetota bacterium]
MGSSASSRRFLLLPILALALLGPAGSDGVDPTALPTTTGSPTPQSPGEQARALIIDALEAQQVYYVDNLVFASATGSELETLRELDPTVAWGTAVIVQVPASEGEDNPILILRAPLPEGTSICLALVTTERDAGLWYALAAKDAKCPKARAGMRGWSPDETTWGL